MSPLCVVRLQINILTSPLFLQTLQRMHGRGRPSAEQTRSYATYCFNGWVPKLLKSDHRDRTRREGVARAAILQAVLPLGLPGYDRLGVIDRIRGFERSRQLRYVCCRLGRHKLPEPDLGRRVLVARVHDLQRDRMTVLTSFRVRIQRCRHGSDVALNQLRLIAGGEHLRQVAGRLKPDLRRIEKKKALVPAVVVLAVWL